MKLIIQIAALTEAVADLREVQQRTTQADAAFRAAMHLRCVSSTEPGQSGSRRPAPGQRLPQPTSRPWLPAGSQTQTARSGNPATFARDITTTAARPHPLTALGNGGQPSGLVT